MSIVKVNGVNCMKLIDGEIIHPENQEQTDFFNGKIKICKIGGLYLQYINGIIQSINKEMFEYSKLAMKTSQTLCNYGDVINNINKKLLSNYKYNKMAEKLRKKLDAKKK